MAYDSLTKDLEEQIKADRAVGKVNPYAFRDSDIVRRLENPHDKGSIFRPDFVRDIEKIVNIPYYNRLSDKTQVFSLYKNDDISRRAIHVQLVSRIARNIGRALNLNEDLIEAIAIGHDIGHTPFGHAGERKLSEIYHGRTGRYFNHNVHGVRVLDKLVTRNISLQTLDGVLCHNGEMELQEYRPVTLSGFDEFDKKVEACMTDENNIKKLIPSTLEACVVRISDIIAYLGKDRQDAEKIRLRATPDGTSEKYSGSGNAEIINNMSINLIQNSYGLSYIKMDKKFFTDLKQAKKDNYEKIYNIPALNQVYVNDIYPMFDDMYEELLRDYAKNGSDSYIFTNHINYLEGLSRNHTDYRNEPIDDIIVDYIASMTDDYFIEFYEKLFPGKHKVEYVGYFE